MFKGIVAAGASAVASTVAAEPTKPKGKDLIFFLLLSNV